MRYLLLPAFLALLMALPSWGAPIVSTPSPTGPKATEITFPLNDLADSQAIGVSGYCSVRAQIAGSDSISLYAITTATTAASSGTLIRTFAASTTTVATFTAGTRWIKAVATTASTGGSVMTIECAPMTGGGGGGASCASGSTKGGGLDEDTGLYEWTCGNYAWSAEYGGIDGNGVSSYNTPTTVGGNSWTLLCTGDGTASNGTAAEQSICLEDGEQIKMYAMADIMLAQDFTRPGGTVYLPDGIFHDRYCGQSAAAVANGCPITRRSPTHQTRKISMSRGIMLDMNGFDPDGPHTNGRTGTWLISDHGGDSDNDGTISDNVTDPGGYAGYLPGHWAFRVGLAGGVNTDRICATSAGISGCITTNAAVRDQDTEPLNLIGRSASLIATDFNTINGADPYLCVENRPGTAGVCANDPRVQCTADLGCSAVGGTCVGPADAMETLLETNADSETNGSNASNGMYVVISSFAQSDYGTDDVNTASSQSVYAAVSNVSDLTCNGGNGRYVALGDMQDARSFYATTNQKHEFGNWNPIQFPEYDTAVQSARMFVVTPEILFNPGGGFSNGNFMPGSWKDRRSITATADCTNNWLGTYEAACDDVDIIALGAGVGGGLYDSSVWYGGGMGGFAYSKIDGDVSGFSTEAKRNWFMRGYGLQTDASGWTFEDNIWQDIAGNSHGSSFSGTNIIALAFAPGFRMYRDRFINVAGDSLFYFQNATGSIVRDIEINGAVMGSIVNVRGARRALIDGITGHGIRSGAPIQINPTTASDVFDVVVSNVNLDNHSMWVSTQTQAKSVVWATDSNSGGGDVTGPVRVENVSMSVHGDDSYCALFLDGGNGDESSAANGSGRTVDDWRHLLTFKNINLERISDGSVAGTFQATCLGDASPTASGSNGPEDGLLAFNVSEGGMPRWEQIYLNGVMYPDNPINSQTAASAGDCQDLVHGTSVLVHDATVASTCTDAGADGILDGGGADPNKVTVRCSCNPAGDTADGQWGVAF